jgi:hypothetical protein
MNQNGPATTPTKAPTTAAREPVGNQASAWIENQWGIKHSHGSADATKYDKDFTGKQQVVLNHPFNSLD